MAETVYGLSGPTADKLMEVLEQRPSLGEGMTTSGGERQCGWVKMTLSTYYTQRFGTGIVQIANSTSSGDPASYPGYGPHLSWDTYQSVDVRTKLQGYYLVNNYVYWGHCVGANASGTPIWVVDGSSYNSDCMLFGRGLAFEDDGAALGTTTGYVDRLCVDVGLGLRYGPATSGVSTGGTVAVKIPSSGSGLVVDAAGVKIDPTQGLVLSIPYLADVTLTSTTSGGVTTYALNKTFKNIQVYANGGCITNVNST